MTDFLEFFGLTFLILAMIFLIVVAWIIVRKLLITYVDEVIWPWHKKDYLAEDEQDKPGGTE